MRAINKLQDFDKHLLEKKIITIQKKKYTKEIVTLIKKSHHQNKN